MQVTTTSFTVAEYCQQMIDKSVVVNKKYQRSPGVWPPASRSYLIDTILSGYPIPKLSLYQKTDLRSRKTRKEIVDGQQRSQSILDFYENRLRISGKESGWKGKRFSDLEGEDQLKFLEYSLSVDLFVGATDPEIRQVFRRINAYQVPLNNPEARHATFQGVFKWFVVGITEKYAQLLKDIGVFTERQLIRMSDAALITEVIYAHEKGIESASDPRLKDFYKEHEETFEAEKYARLLDHVFSAVLELKYLHNGALMKSYHFYSLMLALSHVVYRPVDAFQELFEIDQSFHSITEAAQFRLSQLAVALEEPDAHRKDFGGFLTASEKGTNRLSQRQTRFRWMCAALTDSPFPS